MRGVSLVARAVVARLVLLGVATVEAGEELDFFTNDLNAVLHLTVFGLPLARAEATADIDGSALADILLDELGNLVEDRDVVPFGFFGALTVLGESARGGDGERANFVTLVLVNYRVLTDVTDEYYLVHRCRHFIFPWGQSPRFVD